MKKRLGALTAAMIDKALPIGAGTAINTEASDAKRAPWVKFKLSFKERQAGIAMIKTLADDLSYNQGNYAATLESITIRARALFDDESNLMGRGQKGPSKICGSCDGIYKNKTGRNR